MTALTFNQQANICKPLHIEEVCAITLEGFVTDRWVCNGYTPVDRYVTLRRVAILCVGGKSWQFSVKIILVNLFEELGLVLKTGI